MRRYLAVIIILLSANLAASFAPGDIEWASGVSGTLNKGGTLVHGEYMVKAVQFPSPVPGIKDIHGNIVPETDVPPSVLIEIYKNGVLLNTQILSPGSEPYIDPDYEVKITAAGFPASNAQLWVYEYYSPWATVSIQKRGLPKLDVTVTTDKSSYTSYDDMTITATATVTNSGDARAENVDLNLNIGDLHIRGGDISQLHQHYYTMEAGASQSFSVILEVPQLLNQKSYNLSADAKGLDVKDLEYNATNTYYITVSPKAMQVTISKAVKDRIYLNDPVNVSISVGNDGIYELKNITVTDSMNENFELKSNTPLRWVIPNLKPGEEWLGTTYSIQALGTSLSGFTIPAANATFRFNNISYTIYSTTTTVVVNGPKIVLNKTVDKTVVNISEDVTVNVSINNVGNIVATNAAVNDSLPDGVSFVNGTISFLNGMTSLGSTSLDVNTPVIFNYTIRMDKEGEIKLPSAVAIYTDIGYRGTTRSVLSSERPVITVINPSKITSTPTGTPTAIKTVGPSQTTPQETTTTPEKTEESFTQKIIRALKELFHEPTANPQPKGTPEPTPTPITPGFDFVFALIVLIIAALYRHK
ncbi:MAG: hypothetical protein ABOK23_05755 [Candidatus Methanoperedens sp.]|nr:hypothetical protein [Candidatus Methanoperedens sp.]